MKRSRRFALVPTLLLLWGSSASAQPSESAWAFTPGKMSADLVVVAGLPTVLPTGLTRGVGGGLTWGCLLGAGFRISWTTASEATPVWRVTHDELRVHATGNLQHRMGRGTIALRLGAGGTLVSETRLRQQGKRAGLSGDELQTEKLALLPTASLALAISLPVRGAWQVQLAGGPSIALLDGSARGAWSTEIGVAWQR